MSLSSCTSWRWASALLIPISLLFPPQPAHAQFAQPKVVPTTGEVAGLSVGDTQLQGKQDILYVEKPSADSAVTVGLLLNTGTGTFNDSPQNRHIFQNVFGVVATIADMNGDGIPDFVFATSPSAQHGPQLCTLLGTGSAAPATAAYSAENSGCTSFTIPGDKPPVFTSVAVSLDSTGPRIYVADSANGQLYVLTGDGTNLLSYALVSSFPLSTSAAPQFVAGPFQASSTKPDLIVDQSGLLVPYANNGDSSHFTALAPLPSTPSFSALVPSALRLADLDGDGNADLVGVYAATGTDPNAPPNQLYIWFGHGDGSFGQPQILTLSRRFTMAAIADMDNDRHPDIVLADNATLSILYNQGGSTFRNDFGSGCTSCGEQQFPAPQTVNVLAALDVTADGRADLILANGPASQSSMSNSSPAAPHVSTTTTSHSITVLPRLGSTPFPTGTVTSTPDPTAPGAQFAVTVTYTIASGSPAPAGGVQFTIGGSNFGGPVTVTQSTTNPSVWTATQTGTSANNTPPGSYPVTATYTGDANYASGTSSGQHTIGASGTTTQVLICVGPSSNCPSSGPFSPLPAYTPTIAMTFGQYINLVAPVSKNNPQDPNPLTGTITFTLDGNVLCSYTVITQQCPASAIQTLDASLQGGQHVFTATYANDPNYTGSSSSVTINVAPDPTTTTLTGAPNPALQGTPVTFTITVTGQYAAPTGTFTFSNGTTALGTATLAPSSSTTSTATFTTSSLPVGTDQVSANYGGNQNFLPSSSGSFAEVITAPGTAGFQLTVGPTPLRVAVGTTGQLSVTVTSVNGFSAPVNLSCAGLPREATCTFGSPVINGSGATSLLISTTAPHDCNNSQPYFIGFNGTGMHSLALPTLAGVFALCLPGRRRWIRGLLMLLLATGTVSMSGCGNCTDLATRPGTYHFNVNATTSGGSGTSGQSQAVTLTVYI